MYIYILEHPTYEFYPVHWSKETPSPGGVSYLLCSLIKNRVWEDPPRRTWYKSFEGGPLTHGSWWGNIVNRNPPRGGGVFSINIFKHVHIYLFLCHLMCMYLPASQLLYHTRFLRDAGQDVHLQIYIHLLMHYTHVPHDYTHLLIHCTRTSLHFIPPPSIFIGKVVFICLVGAVNLVLKCLGQPGETRFQPGGDEISSGVPMAFNTKLTEPKGK